MSAAAAAPCAPQQRCGPPECNPQQAPQKIALPCPIQPYLTPPRRAHSFEPLRRGPAMQCNAGAVPSPAAAATHQSGGRARAAACPCAPPCARVPRPPAWPAAGRARHRPRKSPAGRGRHSFLGFTVQKTQTCPPCWSPAGGCLGTTDRPSGQARQAPHTLCPTPSQISSAATPHQLARPSHAQSHNPQVCCQSPRSRLGCGKATSDQAKLTTSRPTNPRTVIKALKESCKATADQAASMPTHPRPVAKTGEAS
jgi:hypothetical protein